MLLLNQWIVKNCLMENITGLIKIYLQILFQFTNGMFAFVFLFCWPFSSLLRSFTRSPSVSIWLGGWTAPYPMYATYIFLCLYHRSNRDIALDGTLCRYTLQAMKIFNSFDVEYSECKWIASGFCPSKSHPIRTLEKKHIGNGNGKKSAAEPEENCFEWF